MDSPCGSPNSDRQDGGEFQFTFESLITSSTRSILESLGVEGSCSVSLTESVFDFPQEFGRTFHAYKAGLYLFPNDDIEQDRLAIQTEAIERLCSGKVHFAPFSDKNPPRNVLDLATGTGDWAIQIGEMFPSTKVIATDLSPIQPTLVPPNVHFYIEDSSERWIYSERFDYIHTRGTAGCWQSFEKDIAAQAFEWLYPGGYFESVELDNYTGLLCSGSPPALKDIYRRVGFEDVHELILPMPMNGWPDDPMLKRIGGLWERNFLSGLSGMTLSIFTRVFELSPEDVEACMAPAVALINVRRELSDLNVHAYMNLRIVWGRKPVA
ncbi:hypothetical protein HIM_06211 [Hirsutella minnesotensis 3608]|uniref:Methyltransferase domain-containing protein n=1 Tax=Hirsutella minnesotensis 3608 TaxID=1043627 RepID=A0A0F7ZJH1_9HYPO|nr:hypothetical protein HIM_06211 [Hirsutella minnesotensis 3608]